MGGSVELHAHKHVTHTISSMALSGKKMHAVLTGQGQGARTVGRLVQPGWVFECAKQGRRVSERSFPVGLGALRAGPDGGGAERLGERGTGAAGLETGIGVAAGAVAQRGLLDVWRSRASRDGC